MANWGTLFSTVSQAEILRALSHHADPIGLRQAARLADVHPHSAELALSSLVEAGMVKRKRRGSRALYHLNRNHPHAEVLMPVFEASERGFIKMRSRSLNRTARRILPLLNRANKIRAHARRSKDEAR